MPASCGGLWGLACAEGLAWGIFCSLVIRSPLRATVAAVLAVTLANQFAVTLTPTHNLTQIVSYVEAIPFRLALLALVVVADVWLLPRWMSGQFPRVRRTAPASRIARVIRLAAQARPSSESYRVVGHLVWQSWREGWKNLLSLVVVVPLTLIFLAEIFGAAQWLTSGTLAQLLSGSLVLAAPFVLLGALVGGLAFHADQRQGPRFLAERGVSARAVWISRQLAWGGWLPVWGALLVVLPIAQPGQHWITPTEPTVPLGTDFPGLFHLVETSTQQWTRNAWLLWEMTFFGLRGRAICFAAGAAGIAGRNLRHCAGHARGRLDLVDVFPGRTLLVERLAAAAGHAAGHLAAGARLAFGTFGLALLDRPHRRGLAAGGAACDRGAAFSRQRDSTRRGFGKRFDLHLAPVARGRRRCPVQV